MPENSGQGPITKFYGIGTGGLYSTGAGAGSEGITAAEDGAPLATVGIVPVYQSSQGAPDMVDVNVGDTYSASSDQTPPMWAGDGTPQSSAAWSAGTNHIHPRNPNAGGPGAGAGAS
jgi:hypothetical protein